MGQVGKYPGSDKKAKADIDLWRTIEQGFGMIQEGFRLTEKDIGERRGFMQEQSAFDFGSLENQFGQDATGRNLNFLGNQRQSITNADEMVNQFSNQQALTQFKEGAGGLALDRREQEQAFGAEELKATMDRKNAVYQSYLDFQKNRQATAFDASRDAGFNINEILTGYEAGNLQDPSNWLQPFDWDSL